MLECAEKSYGGGRGLQVFDQAVVRVEPGTAYGRGMERHPAQPDQSPTPARRLVEAFGDCDAMAALYSDDVTWRLNHSLAPRVAGPHVGKEAVMAFNSAVFTKFYEPGSIRVDIDDEVGDEASSVVRFDFHATTRKGHSYHVEYVLFAKTTDGLICEVVELLDTHASNEQHAGNAIGVPSPPGGRRS